MTSERGYVGHRGAPAGARGGRRGDRLPEAAAGAVVTARATTWPPSSRGTSTSRWSCWRGGWPTGACSWRRRASP